MRRAATLVTSGIVGISEVPSRRGSTALPLASAGRLSEVSAGKLWRRLGNALRLRLHRRLERLDDSAALLLAVDLCLRFDGEPGTGQLLLGPQCFDGRANFGTLDRDRGVGSTSARSTSARAAARRGLATALSSCRWVSVRKSVAVRVSGPAPGTPVMWICGQAGEGRYSQRATTSASSRWRPAPDARCRARPKPARRRVWSRRPGRRARREGG